MKPMERSFAYKGVLAIVLGLVVAAPGAVAQWWPALLRIENSRNLRPLVAAVCLGIGGLVLLAGLAYALADVFIRGARKSVKRHGRRLTATPLGVDVDYGRLAHGRPSYVLRCLHSGPEGKRMYHSPPLWRDPGRRLKPEVTVWVHPKNPARYYVDVADSMAPAAPLQK